MTKMIQTTTVPADPRCDLTKCKHVDEMVEGSIKSIDHRGRMRRISDLNSPCANLKRVAIQAQPSSDRRGCRDS
jgi:hypothetical protein